jgi:hypothetical protein
MSTASQSTSLDQMVEKDYDTKSTRSTSLDQTEKDYDKKSTRTQICSMGTALQFTSLDQLVQNI